jgi:transketolase
MVVAADAGHLGGTFSCTDILVALYYGGILRFDPHNPHWDGRDRFILSKGHAGLALYLPLADLGFFPISELESFAQRGSALGINPDNNIPGVEINTGSLGHGLGVGAGLSLSGKIDRKDFCTVVLLGDGECYEGSVWEAALFAAHHELNKLTAIIDYNGLSATDFTKNIIRQEPVEDKWKAFGWNTVSINGHSFAEILHVLKDIHGSKSNKPLAVVAHTIKGKGVSFMENKISWHHGAPRGDELKVARRELTS